MLAINHLPTLIRGIILSISAFFSAVYLWRKSWRTIACMPWIQFTDIGGLVDGVEMERQVNGKQVKCHVLWLSLIATITWIMLINFSRCFMNFCLFDTRAVNGYSIQKLLNLSWRRNFQRRQYYFDIKVIYQYAPAKIHIKKSKSFDPVEVRLPVSEQQ